MKVCNVCGEEKDLSHFTLRKDTGRYRNECNPCRNSKYMERYRNSPEVRVNHRKHSRKYSLFVNYGLSVEEVEAMLQSQEGVCKICRTEVVLEGSIDEFRRAACVDHCHSTGKVRGILCRQCNSGLGHFKDSPELLAAAGKYLHDS